MKKTFKVLSLLLIMALVSISLVGCTSDELSVYNAMLKSQSIESMEAKTTVSFDFSATGLSEEYDADIQMLAQSLNDLKLVLNQKYQLQDMKNLVSKAQIDGIINLSGTAMDFSLWVDTNFSDENPILKEIIKLPPMVSMLLPQEFSGKQYIVLDLNKMPEDCFQTL